MQKFSLVFRIIEFQKTLKEPNICRNIFSMAVEYSNDQQCINFYNISDIYYAAKNFIYDNFIKNSKHR